MGNTNGTTACFLTKSNYMQVALRLSFSMLVDCILQIQVAVPQTQLEADQTALNFKYLLCHQSIL